MRNSDSAHLFTYNYFWKLVSISIISAVFIPLYKNNYTKISFRQVFMVETRCFVQIKKIWKGLVWIIVVTFYRYL